jgi:hypothetical protein
MRVVGFSLDALSIRTGSAGAVGVLAAVCVDDTKQQWHAAGRVLKAGDGGFRNRNGGDLLRVGLVHVLDGDYNGREVAIDLDIAERQKINACGILHALDGQVPSSPRGRRVKRVLVIDPVHGVRPSLADSAGGAHINIALSQEHGVGEGVDHVVHAPRNSCGARVGVAHTDASLLDKTCGCTPRDLNLGHDVAVAQIDPPERVRVGVVREGALVKWACCVSVADNRERGQPRDSGGERC